MRRGGLLLGMRLCGAVAPRASLPLLLLQTRGNASQSSSSGVFSDAEMQRKIFKSAMSSADTDSPAAAMASFTGTSDFTEERLATPGTSEEDAYGHTDPLMAVEDTVRQMDKASSGSKKDKKTPPSEQQAEKASIVAEIDQVVSNGNRRRNRRKRSMDTVLGDVLHDALRMRDMGEKPSADFVYKRTQERIYEEEYGRKPPTAKETAAQYVPFPPDFHMHRLLPLFPAADADFDGGAVASRRGEGSDGDAGADAAQQPRPVTQPPVYTKNHMHMHAMMPSDPWPERAITPENPVWTRHAVDTDKQNTNGKGLSAWEARMYDPRPGYDLTGEFVDAMDELAHWEAHLLRFLRGVPISQRRSLPYLHEWYRLYVHRVIRAERRYIRVRDALLQQTKVSTAVFARTEKLIDDVRGYYSETHRSLSSPNYDPLRMKKSILAPVLRMTDAEFEEWQDVQRQRRNALAAEFS